MFNNTYDVLSRPDQWIKENIEIIPYMYETNRRLEDLKTRVRNIAKTLNESEGYDASYDYIKSTARLYDDLKGRVKYTDRFYIKSEEIKFTLFPIIGFRLICKVNDFSLKKYFYSMIGNAPSNLNDDYITFSSDCLLIATAITYNVTKHARLIFDLKNSNYCFLKDQFFNHLSSLLRNKKLTEEEVWPKVKEQLSKEYLTLFRSDIDSLQVEFEKALDKFRSQILVRNSNL